MSTPANLSPFELILPPSLHISKSSVRYIDSTGVSVGTYTGIKRTAAIGGDRLAMAVTFTTVGGASASGAKDRAILQGFLAAIRGKQSRFYAWDRSYVQRGSFPAPELVSNNAFSSGTTGWTGSGGNAMTESGNVLRTTLTSVASDQSVRAPTFSVTSGAAYAGRILCTAGYGTMGWKAALGTTAGGTNLAVDSSTLSAPGLSTVSATVTSSCFLSMQDMVSARSVGGWQEIPYTSCARCARVNGSSQTGSALLLKNLPTSTNDLLMVGDQVEVWSSRGSELKIVTAALNSDSGGNGYLMFAPALRGTVADGDPVIINQPLGRWIYSGQAPQFDNEPGRITTATLEFEEAA